MSHLLVILEGQHPGKGGERERGGFSHDTVGSVDAAKSSCPHQSEVAMHDTGTQKCGSPEMSKVKPNLG